MSQKSSTHRLPLLRHTCSVCGARLHPTQHYRLHMPLNRKVHLPRVMLFCSARCLRLRAEENIGHIKGARVLAPDTELESGPWMSLDLWLLIDNQGCWETVEEIRNLEEEEKTEGE